MIKKTLKIAFLLTPVALIFLITVEAGAFSIQLNTGGGIVSQSKESKIQTDASNYLKLDMNAFMYEGRNVDIFAGVEYLGSSLSHENDYLEKSNMAILAATAGFHYRPFSTAGRWKPYILVGGVGGSVSYNVSPNEGSPSKVLISKSKDSALFATYRAGVGTDVGLGIRFSLGIEANYTGPVPGFKMVFGDMQTGALTEDTINKDTSMLGLNIGLRYAF